MNHNFEKALRHLRIAEHMAKVTFPLVNEKKILVKCLEQIYLSLVYLIETADKGFIKKPVKISKSALKKTKITDYEIAKINEIIENYNIHKKSAIEFSKNNKLVIMSDNLGIKTLDHEKILDYIKILKSIFLKIGATI